eukprot:1128446-Lingulodinium_polyedra.AAC.1
MLGPALDGVLRLRRYNGRARRDVRGRRWERGRGPKPAGPGPGRGNCRSARPRNRPERGDRLRCC